MATEAGDRSRLDQLPRQATLAGWPTALGNDARGSKWSTAPRTDGQERLLKLPGAADQAGWLTPQTRDVKDGDGTRDRPRGVNLPEQTALAGWATPTASPANGTPEAFLDRKRRSMERGSASMGITVSDLQMQAIAWAGWPTPAKANGDGSQMPADATTTGRRPDGSKATVALPMVASAAGWPTPVQGDVNLARGTSDYAARTSARKASPSSVVLTAHMAGWPTPMAATPPQNGNSVGGNTDSSRKATALAGWPTPRHADEHSETLDAARREWARPHKGGGSKLAVETHQANWADLPDDGPIRLMADGRIVTGSGAGMDAGGLLNPALSRWLMGYPRAWDRAAICSRRSSRAGTRTRKRG